MVININEDGKDFYGDVNFFGILSKFRSLLMMGKGDVFLGRSV